jgi:pimeloyl-ACP methyl ester carboxylesterase
MSRSVVLLLALAVGCSGGGSSGRDVIPAASEAETPAVGDRYLIYLHGRIIEDQGPRAIHPRFGMYEYPEILEAFTSSGFRVSSRQRPAGSRPPEAARDTAAEVRRLLDAAVPADAITVVGFSKGGMIAVLTAVEVDDPRVNYVFMACCGPWIDSLFEDPERRIRGRMLSIFEASDDVGSCAALFAHASADSVTSEVELHLGGGHGAFYGPRSGWLEPVVRWARGDDPG